MKTIYQRIEDLSKVSDPIVLAIGVFDGVHKGHQSLLSRTVEDAKAIGGKAIALTFDPHPLSILQPQKTLHYLTSPSQKTSLLFEYRMDEVLVLPFTKEFSRQLPEEFLNRLLSAAKDLREICVGFQWSFGRDRKGNIAFLTDYGKQHNFRVVSIPPVIISESTVSSTRIRHAILTGDLETATQCLGRNYLVTGEVVHGAKLGAKLGFPTANLALSDAQFPPNGIYVVRVKWKQKSYQGVASIGVRPTIEERGHRWLEVYLFDFNHDLYGAMLDVELIYFLRKEEKFDSVEQLKIQISKDVAAAKNYFAR